MFKQLFTLSFCFFFCWTAANAQKVEFTTFSPTTGGSSRGANAACTNDAGTYTLGAFNGKSNDISLDTIYLCHNDSLPILHNNNADLTGDPQAATKPGVGYAFYKCKPTINGMDLVTIKTDPCIIPTAVGTGILVAASNDPTATNFDIKLKNNGLIQNNVPIHTALATPLGSPTAIWLAPITMDDFVVRGYESPTGTPPFGTCVNVNVSKAFSVVYLNEIKASNSVSAGLCGRFTVAGGLSEFNNSTYNITVTRVGGGVFGTVNTPFGGYKHSDEVIFSVPQSGTYDIVVTDGKACPANFQMTFAANGPLVFTGAQVTGMPGDIVCMNVQVKDFKDIVNAQMTFRWDVTKMKFSSIMNLNLSNLTLGSFGTTPGLVNAGNITFGWNTLGGAGDYGVTVPDGTSIFQICFKIEPTAVAGDFSNVAFDGSLTQLDIRTYCGNMPIFAPTSGKVTVVTNTSSIVLAIQQDSVSCFGLADGKFIVTAVGGGTPPYNFTWKKLPAGTPTGTGNIAANGGSATVSNLTAGKYQIVTQDATGAISTRIDTIEVLQPPALGATLKDTLPSCNGFADGKLCAEISLNGVNITNPGSQYTFKWSNNATTRCITGLTSGAYSFTVTDQTTGCTAVAAATLGQPAALSVSIAKTDVSCTPPNVGTATATAAGGTPAYNYKWSTGSMSASIINLTAGTYKVVATDKNGCKDSITTNILPPNSPKIDSFKVVNVKCNGDNNGTITVFARPGGAAIADYAWSFGGSGATKTNISNLIAGVYSVTVTGADGCTSVGDTVISQPAAIVVDSIVTKNPTCTGKNDGRITVFAQGGVGPFRYIWSNAPADTVTNNLKVGLIAGSYNVAIIDANGCKVVRNAIAVVNPPAVNIVFNSIKSVKCNNGTPCDGQATAVASGGSGVVYSFLWSSGETINNSATSSATALCQGYQKVTVSDANNCTRVDSVLVPSPLPLVLDFMSLTIKAVSCKGLADGGATVAGFGGTSPYTYAWQQGTVGATIGNVAAGTYNVTIKDANNCVKTYPVGVTEPPLLVASIDFSNTRNVTCSNKSDGEVAVKKIGGNSGAFNYAWTNNVSTTSTAVNLPPGTYTVTVTDGKGCNDTARYTVKSPPPIVANIPVPEQPRCFGEQTTVTVTTAAGGNGPIFKFSVDDGVENALIDNKLVPIFAGEHIIKVFDGLGCEFVDTINVTEPPQLVVNLGPDVKVGLGEEVELRGAVQSVYPIDTAIWLPTTGLRFNVSGGNPLQAFASPPNNTTYTLIVTDINGCQGSDDVAVEIDRNRNVYIPNVFSPNGDGTNDFFGVYAGLGVSDVNFMRVFDRWGNLVYSVDKFTPTNSVNKGNGWDGTFKGSPMDVGVYVYIISVGFIDNIQPILYRGDITLVK